MVHGLMEDLVGVEDIVGVEETERVVIEKQAGHPKLHSNSGNSNLVETPMLKMPNTLQTKG